MKIAIDTNEVLRAFLDQFALYYKKGIDRSFDIDNIKYDNFDLRILFPFDSDYQINSFLYEDYVYEIFGCAKPVEKMGIDMFNDWVMSLEDIDTDEEIEVTITSFGEHHKSIPSTLFFYSKCGCIAKNYEFENSVEKIWDKYDILVTANNYLLESKPEGKTSIKIETDYNTDIESDYSFNKFSEFVKNEIIKKLIENGSN